MSCCPNCGERDVLCISSSTIKTWWGGGTLYGVCEKCAKAHQERNETQEEIDEAWRQYHRRYGYQGLIG